MTWGYSLRQILIIFYLSRPPWAWPPTWPRRQTISPGQLPCQASLTSTRCSRGPRRMETSKGKNVARNQIFNMELKTISNICSVRSSVKNVIFLKLKLILISSSCHSRVNYDKRNWQLIAEQLKRDHTKIHVINRWIVWSLSLFNFLL